MGFSGTNLTVCPAAEAQQHGMGGPNLPEAGHDQHGGAEEKVQPPDQKIREERGRKFPQRPKSWWHWVSFNLIQIGSNRWMVKRAVHQVGSDR